MIRSTQLLHNYRSVTPDSVKHTQATSEAVGLLVGLNKTKTAHRYILSFVVWYRADVVIF